MTTDNSCACVQPPFDRDFPSLAGRSTASKTWHSGNGPSEQQWTRLAYGRHFAAGTPTLLSNSCYPTAALGVKQMPSHQVVLTQRSHCSQDAVLGSALYCPYMKNVLKSNILTSSALHCPCIKNILKSNILVRRSHRTMPINCVYMYLAADFQCLPSKRSLLRCKFCC